MNMTTIKKPLKNFNSKKNNKNFRASKDNQITSVKPSNSNINIVSYAKDENNSNNQEVNQVLSVYKNIMTEKEINELSTIKEIYFLGTLPEVVLRLILANC